MVSHLTGMDTAAVKLGNTYHGTLVRVIYMKSESIHAMHSEERINSLRITM